MEQKEQGTEGSGNTKLTRIRARKWCFTLNNYTAEELEAIKKFFIGAKWIIGFEQGEEKETPHLQGYVNFGRLKDFTTLKELNQRIHWAKVRGTENENITYCSKEGNFIHGGGLIKPNKKDMILAKFYTPIRWTQWQQEIVNICDGEEDARSIYWIWEEKGNTGKSFLAKYIWAKYDCCLASGKRTDVLYSINQFMATNKKEPKVILLDIPRSIESQYISYTCLEELKNGLFLSGKYESMEGAFVDIPHIIVFSNREPEFGKMSADRWKVKHITPDGNLVDTLRYPM